MLIILLWLTYAYVYLCTIFKSYNYFGKVKIKNIHKGEKVDLDPDSRLIIVNLGTLFLCLSFLGHKTMTVSIYRADSTKSQSNARTFDATFGTRKDLINACPLLLLGC